MAISNDVKVTYSEYGANAVIDTVELELIEDIKLKLSCDMGRKNVSISMADTISDNTELEGTMTYEKLSVIIRILSQIRNQIKG